MFDLIHHFLRRIITVYQIAEIQHFWIAPVAAETLLDQVSALFFRCENGLSNVQILDIVNFIPELVLIQTFCLDASIPVHSIHYFQVLLYKLPEKEHSVSWKIPG